MNKILWQEIKEAAAKSQATLSDEIRCRLINYSELLKENEFNKSIRESLASGFNQEQNKSQIYPLLAENNLLLRKIARHINSQIVRETDEQLEHHLKNRGS